MPPIRSENASRSLRNSATETESIAGAVVDQPQKPFLVSVLASERGSRYKEAYLDAIVSDFPKTLSRNAIQPNDQRPSAFSLHDLECIRTLGAGAQGHVYLVQAKGNRHLSDKRSTVFALKAINKRTVREEASVQSHMQEKDVERAKLVPMPWNPFVAGVFQTFSDSRNLYLMLEFIPCGSLRSIIQRQAPFPATTAAFYFANIVCGLGFLHRSNIVHNDVKPENLLVGQDGYLCLTDFGSSTLIGDHSAAWFWQGTPVYRAPELSVGRGSPENRFVVDWWSSGCILYELTTRKFPFYGRDEPSTLAKMLYEGHKWPPNLIVGKQLKDIVASLLTCEPKERLGSGGVEDVQDHPWLSLVDWFKVESRQYLAPHVPKDSNLKELWHSESLPLQKETPGLRVGETPIQLLHDNRFPPMPEV